MDGVVMSKGVGGSVGADLAAIEARRRDLAAPIEEAAARLWPVVALNLLHGEPAPWGEISETRRNQIRALVGVASSSLLAEVSRLGQQLREAEQRADRQDGWRLHWEGKAVDIAAECRAALALVGQLQGQLAAVRAQVAAIETLCDDVERGWKALPLYPTPGRIAEMFRAPLAAAVLSDREGTQ